MGLNTFKETATRIPATRLCQLYNLVWNQEGRRFESGEINLIFTTDERMRELNRRFRGKDQSTDVLSFVIDKNDQFLGEIYISVPTAKRQANSYDVSLSDEYLRLACHGMLHLFGHDHMNDDDERNMKQLEERYLQRVS